MTLEDRTDLESSSRSAGWDAAAGGRDRGGDLPRPARSKPSARATGDEGDGGGAGPMDGGDDEVEMLKVTGPSSDPERTPYEEERQPLALMMAAIFGSIVALLAIAGCIAAFLSSDPLDGVVKVYAILLPAVTGPMTGLLGFYFGRRSPEPRRGAG
jgi:hypothetical protein